MKKFHNGRNKYTGDIAVYKGDSLLVIGTIEECMAKLNKSRDAVEFALTPSAHRRNKGNRMIAIRLEGDE